MVNKKTTNFSKNRAFTIIELLVAIVIIGILVAITTVSFNGISKQNRQKALENNLMDSAGKVQAYISKNNRLPDNLGDAGVSSDDGTMLTYFPSVFPNFCIRGNNSESTLYMGSNLKSPGATGCPSPNIQSITKASCSTTRTQVKDARDNNSYYIQKLADGQCWMLTNLAYAGGTSNGGNNAYNDVINQGAGTPGSNTIANGTSDTATTFTLAKYYIPPNANPTIDPTPPSTATDGGVATATRQFGYLYNWCAAMGAQNTAACASATTPAPDPNINICPAGWRLPTGVSTTGEFTALNNAINAGSTTNPTGLETNGLFQRSGYWSNSFNNQGSYGYYWSSSQNSSINARSLYFSSTGVVPANYNYKDIGFAVRCIAL